MDFPLVEYRGTMVAVDTGYEGRYSGVEMTMEDWEQWLCAMLQEVRGRMGKTQWEKTVQHLSSSPLRSSSSLDDG
jgi:hypothetical protein